MKAGALGSPLASTARRVLPESYGLPRAGARQIPSRVTFLGKSRCFLIRNFPAGTKTTPPVSPAESRVFWNASVQSVLPSGIAPNERTFKEPGTGDIERL